MNFTKCSNRILWIVDVLQIGQTFTFVPCFLGLQRFFQKLQTFIVVGQSGVFRVLLGLHDFIQPARTKRATNKPGTDEHKSMPAHCDVVHSSPFQGPMCLIQKLLQKWTGVKSYVWFDLKKETYASSSLICCCYPESGETPSWEAMGSCQVRSIDRYLEHWTVPGQVVTWHHKWHENDVKPSVSQHGLTLTLLARSFLTTGGR